MHERRVRQFLRHVSGGGGSWHGAKRLDTGWLPAEATELREVHDVGSNESALAFRLPAGMKWRPPEACRVTDKDKVYKPAFEREWIPGEWAGFDFYDCWKHLGMPMLAVERTGRRVLLWRTTTW